MNVLRKLWGQPEAPDTDEWLEEDSDDLYGDEESRHMPVVSHHLNSGCNLANLPKQRRLYDVTERAEIKLTGD